MRYSNRGLLIYSAVPCFFVSKDMLFRAGRVIDISSCSIMNVLLLWRNSCDPD